jgi:hypothetical protein
MNISDILVDPSIASRKALNPKRVEHYRQILESDNDLDPVIVFHDGQTNWLSDGFHRIEAYKKADQTQIPTDVRHGTRRDAILYAIEANAKHGLCLSLAERKNAATTLLQDTEWSQWSDRKIGKICGINHETVRSLRNLSGGNRQIENFTKTSDSTEEIGVLRSVSGDFRQIENFTNSDEISSTTRQVERNGGSYAIDTANIGRGRHEKFFNTGSQARSVPMLSSSKVEILNLNPLTINAISRTVEETKNDFQILSIDCSEPSETSNEVVEFNNVKVKTLGPPDAWPTILSQMQAHPEFASMVWKEAQKLELADITIKTDLLLTE